MTPFVPIVLVAAGALARSRLSLRSLFDSLAVPHAFRHRDHQLQLGPLIVVAERVAWRGAGKAALRTHAQSREVDVM